MLVMLVMALALVGRAYRGRRRGQRPRQRRSTHVQRR
jgi:hypothetical protein